MPSDPSDPHYPGRRRRDSTSGHGSHTSGHEWPAPEDQWTTQGRRVRYGKGSGSTRSADTTSHGSDGPREGRDAQPGRQRRSPTSGHGGDGGGVRGLFHRRPLMLVAACVAGGVLATSGFSYAAVNHYTSTIGRQEVFSAMTGERPAQDDGLNIMVVGSDNRAGISEERRLELKLGLADFGRHTDTILVAHVADNGAIDVVSIPRDSEVDIPAYTDAEGTRWDASKGKLNTAYSIGGAPMLVQTFEQNSDVRIDHYLEVDFNGFINIVDALGGVEVCSPVAVDDELSGLDIPAGRSNLDGAMGLSYVRARYFDPSADFGRMQRQQAFLAAMFRKAVSGDVLLNPAKINSVVSSGLASLTGDEELDQDRIKGLISSLKGTDPQAVRFITLPTGGDAVLDDGGSAVVWDEQGSTAIFAGMRGGGGVFDGIREALANMPVVEVPASEISVAVLNGTGIPGAASAAAARFTKAGFPVSTVANGELTERTTIEVDPRYDSGLATLTTALPDAQVREVSGLGKVAKVTVGKDFRGLAGFRSANQPIDPAAAGTSDDELQPNRSAADDVCS